MGLVNSFAHVPVVVVLLEGRPRLLGTAASTIHTWIIERRYMYSIRSHLPWKGTNGVAQTGPMRSTFARALPPTLHRLRLVPKHFRALLSAGDIVDHANAVIHAYLPGPDGGVAIAETLFGINNPSGRLSFT